MSIEFDTSLKFIEFSFIISNICLGVLFINFKNNYKNVFKCFLVNPNIFNKNRIHYNYSEKF
jgi:hypothetical protein